MHKTWKTPKHKKETVLARAKLSYKGQYLWFSDMWTRATFTHSCLHPKALLCAVDGRGF